MEIWADMVSGKDYFFFQDGALWLYAGGEAERDSWGHCPCVVGEEGSSHVLLL